MSYLEIIFILVTILIGICLKRIFFSHSNEFVAKRDDTLEITNAGGLVEFIKREHEKQGSPLVEFYMGPGNRFVSINEPNLIKQLNKLGSRPIHLFDFIVPLFGEDNLQVYSSERALKLRKLIANAFGTQLINQKYDTLLNIGNETIVEKWTKNCAAKSSVYIQQDFLNFGLNSIIYATLGIEADKLNKMSFKKDYDESMNGLYDKQFGHSSTLNESTIEKAINSSKQTLKSIINERKETFSRCDGFESKTNDLFDILFSSNDPDNGKPFTEEKILSILSIYLIAGYHTTAIGLVWLMFALSQHPSVYFKVQREIDENVFGAMPSQKELENLKYLDQVIKETLRVYTPGSFVARLVEEDIVLTLDGGFKNKYKLKKGTNLFFPLFSLHKNKTYWTNPEKFEPERFDEQQNVNSIYPYSYAPFGFGPRICPGERLNRVETKMMITMIIKQFEFELDMNVSEVLPEEKFVVMAKNDVRMKLKQRVKN